MDWFLYENSPRHERVKWIEKRYDAISDCYKYDF